MAPFLTRIGTGGGTGGFGFGKRTVSATSTGLPFPAGAVYAYSGNDSAADLTGNGNTIVYAGKGFSATQKKWAEYSKSFNLPADDTVESRIQTPIWTPSSSGWSLEFWVYPTTWAGKYLLACSDPVGGGSIAINVQSNEFRFYRIFNGDQINVSENTSNYLNAWNFFQVYYNGSSTIFRINGTTKATFSGNTNTPAFVKLGNGGDGFPVTGYMQDIVLYNGVNRGNQASPTTPFGL